MPDRGIRMRKIYNRMPRKWRLTILFLMLFAGILILVLEPQPLLRMWGRSLERWTPVPAHSDAVFILLGDAAPRAAYAAKLYEEGHTSRIALTRSRVIRLPSFFPFLEEAAIAESVLVRLSVPKSRITILPGAASSTAEEALSARDWGRENRMSSIVFVTSSFHSSRAWWILSRVFADSGISIQVAAVPDPSVTWQPWWSSEEGLITIFNETIKSLYYRLRYRRV